MTSSVTSKKKSSKYSWGTPLEWKTFVTGILAITVAIRHATAPEQVTLDWPTVGLMVFGFLLLLMRQLVHIFPYIRKLKWGDAEVQLQERVAILSEEIESLEDAEKPEPPPAPGGATTSPSTVEAALDTDPASQILELAAKDKEAALIKLAIEIEREMILLSKPKGLSVTRSTWRALVTSLTEHGIITPDTGDALLQFRDLRNQVIHSGFGGPVQQRALDSALDSGLRLLLLIKRSRGSSATRN